MLDGFAFAKETSGLELSTTTKWVRGCEKLFSLKSKMGTGDGEMSVAAMLLNIVITDPNSLQLKELIDPFISGQDESFDVSITEEKISNLRTKYAIETGNWTPITNCFGKTEVKKPGDNGRIRLGDEGMRATIHGYKFFWDVAEEVEKAVTAMKELLELTLHIEDFACLMEFINVDVPDINRICLSSGRAIGEEAGIRTHQKFGLYQAVKILSQVKKAKINIQKSKYKIRIWDVDDKKNSVFLTGTPRAIVEVIGASGMKDDNLVRELKKLKMNDLQIDILRYLNHDVFDNPEIIKSKFRELAPPREAFIGIDRLALVSKTHVRFIPKDALNQELQLTGIAQGGRPSYACEMITSNAE